uniref:Glycosyl transferase family 1 domain-containing protein n=1 Tax=uncultured Alphaproteobacteria bacterium TaxID=91750 RepID=A0A6G8F330_9PROT|nr:hypothetical protein PlAlph_5550 [uncultured Alphaproteobacteria bacterium]
MWFQKIKKVGKGKVTKRIKICGVTILKKEKGDRLRWWVFGVPLFSVINKKSPFYIASIKDKECQSKVVSSVKSAPKSILWVDHSLGGGTDTYSRNQFAAAADDVCILRLQYFSAYQRYLLTLPKSAIEVKCSFAEIEEVYNFLRQFQFDEIIVNNLVGYPNSLDVLDRVARLKKNAAKKPKVSFRGHDFQCICPSFNLLNCDGVFCNLAYKDGCDICLQKKMLGNNAIENKILRSGVENMESWRRGWSVFFMNTVDEVIVFSKSIKRIFCEIYPQMDSKIKVVPHKTHDFPNVKIEKHQDVNIGMLGEISLYQKGGDVVRQMCGCLKNYPDVNLIVVGHYHNAPANLRVTGKYRPEDLPEIMKKEKVDIVFIPSVWPETFSYTTSEAISMGLPVACYDFGAPAERVSVYDKGLVLKNIDAAANLAQLVEFAKQIRKDL